MLPMAVLKIVALAKYNIVADTTQIQVNIAPLTFTDVHTYVRSLHGRSASRVCGEQYYKHHTDREEAEVSN